MKTVILLTISNLFMTLAWYGHLKYLRGAKWPLFAVILVSWGIAFFEYCFQVPANRIGYATFSATQLKILQEVISLVVFSLFAVSIAAGAAAFGVSAFIGSTAFGASIFFSALAAAGAVTLAAPRRRTRRSSSGFSRAWNSRASRASCAALSSRASQSATGSKPPCGASSRRQTARSTASRRATARDIGSGRIDARSGLG